MILNKKTDKIVIGISQDSDVKELLNLGFRQFFFGFVPEDFATKYGYQLSLNRRYYQEEQFTDINKTLDVIKLIKSKDGKIYIALNPMQINNTIFSYMKEVFNTFKDEIDGVIVSDISFLQYLKSINYNNITLSNLFGFYNLNSIKLFVRKFNLKRIILPRDISINYIKKVAETFKDLEIEVFLFGDNCMFSESFCFAEHGYKEFPEPLCKYTIYNMKPVKKPAVELKQKALNTKDLLCLKKKFLDIDTLIHQIMKLYNQQKDISPILEILAKYDTKYLSQHYDKILFITSALDNTLAKKIKERLQNTNTQNIDTYSQFHKNNSSAIEKILEILDEYPNIYFKIPLRGRKLKIKTSKYDYSESQYKLPMEAR